MKTFVTAVLTLFTATSFAAEPVKKDAKSAAPAASAPAKQVPAKKPDVVTKQDAQNVPSAAPAPKK